MKFNPAAFTRAILGAATNLHIASIRLVVRMDDTQVEAARKAAAGAARVVSAATKAFQEADQYLKAQVTQNKNLRTAAAAELKSLGARL